MKQSLLKFLLAPVTLAVFISGCNLSVTKNCDDADATVQLSVSGSDILGYTIEANTSNVSSISWSTGETGVYSITGLSAGTYSVEVEGYDGCTVTESVTTQPVPTVTDIDGNVYEEVVIGNQTWLRPNLRTTRFRNGDAIPLKNGAVEWGSSLSPARSIGEFNNGTSFLDTQHGMHYNWYAATDERGICPDGYHIPTTEWGELILELGALNVAGNKMKLITDYSYDQWDYPENQGDNSSGFSAVPSGRKDYQSGAYFDVGANAYFWSAEQGVNSNYGLSFKLRATSAVVSSSGTEQKTMGYSCRCVKD